MKKFLAATAAITLLSAPMAIAGGNSGSGGMKMKMPKLSAPADFRIDLDSSLTGQIAFASETDAADTMFERVSLSNRQLTSTAEVDTCGNVCPPKDDGADDYYGNYHKKPQNVKVTFDAFNFDQSQTGITLEDGSGQVQGVFLEQVTHDFAADYALHQGDKYDEYHDNY